MDIGLLEYAPVYVSSVASRFMPGASVFAFFRQYPNSDVTKFPSLRDRTDELTKAVKGIMWDQTKEIVCIEFSGLQLKSYGMDPIGAEYIQRYKIILG